MYCINYYYVLQFLGAKIESKHEQHSSPLYQNLLVFVFNYSIHSYLSPTSKTVRTKIKVCTNCTTHS